MTDQIVNDAEKIAADVKDTAGSAITHADAEVAANIATARTRVHSLGHDIEAVAGWLVATTRGAVADVADAVRWIGEKL